MVRAQARNTHRLTGQIGIADVETLLNTGWIAEALELMRANPLGVTPQQLERVRPRFPVAIARIEVLRWLAHLERIEPAILDTVKAVIGPEEKWDLSTPSRLPLIIEQHTRLVG